MQLCVEEEEGIAVILEKPLFVPIYKKADKNECGNYRTIALISHASKVLLRVLLKRREVFLVPELPIEQAGVRREMGTRDHITDIRWMMERAREHQQDLYMCFIDYKKVFDCVDHEIMWIILAEMGVPAHLVVLLRNMYTQIRKRQSKQSLERRNSSTSGKVCDRVVSCLLLRRENNEGSFGHTGRRNRHRRKSGNEFEIRG